ncbi:gamma-glutamyltransferase [Haliea sp. E17]|uniref:gamma-glutamyltransferase n=1 Tax=Haliea sp. E17 TaxID=3401576 RepID=UPI003AAC14D3
MKFQPPGRVARLAAMLAIVSTGLPLAAIPAGAEVRTSEDVLVQEIRPEVGGLHAAVVSEHPLASQVGYEVLKAGGNAVDAAVSMAAMLAVVRPHMNSVGGDTFALFYEAQSGDITALNSSGTAAGLAEPGFYTTQGLTRMPFTGPLTVTVPGTVAAWEAALARYGTISLSEALQPAIRVAEEGFMVSTTLAADLEQAGPRLNAAGKAVYYPNERPLQAGDVVKNPDLGQSLRSIAKEGAGVMYGGKLGAKIADFLEAEGSPLRRSDFAGFKPEWTTPASIPFHGKQVYTVRPNSQGIVLLQMLAMAETRPVAAMGQNSAELLHQMIEITRIAFADRDRWVADPAYADVPVTAMLDRDYLNQRAALIGERASGDYISGLSIPDDSGALMNEDGDTVYLMVVDEDGNAVSWVQSLFGSFGSNLMVPGTGIVLHNRGASFSLEEGHPNQVAPGKRPFHTLMSTMVTDDEGKFAMAIGTPGGSGQPQFIGQALLNSLVFGMSPQQAIEAPRFRIGSGTEVVLDQRLPGPVVETLASKGQQVTLSESWVANFGSLQIIQRLSNGVLRTGADMRREATALAY